MAVVTYLIRMLPLRLSAKRLPTNTSVFPLLCAVRHSCCYDVSPPSYIRRPVSSRQRWALLPLCSSPQGKKPLLVSGCALRCGAFAELVLKFLIEPASRSMFLFQVNFFLWQISSCIGLDVLLSSSPFSSSHIFLRYGCRGSCHLRTAPFYRRLLCPWVPARRPLRNGTAEHRGEDNFKKGCPSCLPPYRSRQWHTALKHA